mmetsp:Transcript_95310/g.188940  ORF Transcript_95310/g.188940 Transcript_95310/m.188940 type:complete len:268 (+) Transcript_95310:50-853(+)
MPVLLVVSWRRPAASPTCWYTRDRHRCWRNQQLFSGHVRSRLLRAATSKRSSVPEISAGRFLPAVLLDAECRHHSWKRVTNVTVKARYVLQASRRWHLRGLATLAAPIAPLTLKGNRLHRRFRLHSGASWSQTLKNACGRPGWNPRKFMCDATIGCQRPTCSSRSRQARQRNGQMDTNSAGCLGSNRCCFGHPKCRPRSHLRSSSHSNWLPVWLTCARKWCSLRHALPGFSLVQLSNCSRRLQSVATELWRPRRRPACGRLSYMRHS